MARAKTAASSRSDVSNILERVTRAEEAVNHMNDKHTEWHVEAKEHREDVAKRLTDLEHALQRYQGAWGTITLVITSIGLALTFFKDFIARKLGLD